MILYIDIKALFIVCSNLWKLQCCTLATRGKRFISSYGWRPCAVFEDGNQIAFETSIDTLKEHLENGKVENCLWWGEIWELLLNQYLGSTGFEAGNSWFGELEGGDSDACFVLQASCCSDLFTIYNKPDMLASAKFSSHFSSLKHTTNWRIYQRAYNVLYQVYLFFC